MTNYVKSTNFASKDSLAQGNPLKIVKGTEIDAEFNNIATAVATKADTTSPTFTGTPTAPTAAYGTNTPQLATTAFVTAALQLIYPVGSIYTNASVATNPATLIGFGTWTAFGTGKVLVGINGADASFDTLGETGGSKDSVVVSHTHTLGAGSTAAAGAHDHYVGSTDSTAGTGGNATQEFIRSYNGGDGPTALTSPVGTHTHSLSGATDATGVSGVNANLQPYVVVHMWLRSA